MLILWQALQEHRVQRQHVLDIPGAVALTTGISLLLLGMLNGGQQGTIDPPFIALGLVLLAVFIAIEMRAKEPLLPLSIFREPFIAVPCIAGLLTGAVQFGISSYVPLFVQGVQLGSAGDSGKVLGSLSIGWPLASFISPRLLLRFGFRPVAIIGTACISIGTILLLGYQVGTPGWFMVANLFVLGVGLGFSSNAFLLAAQNAVGWDRRGVVTASVQFTRTIGGTLGVALLGAVLNAGMRTTLAAAGTSDPNAILNPAIRNTLPASAVHTIQAGLSSGLHQVYLLLAIAAVLGAGAALFFPAGKATSTPPAAPRREPETAATPVPAVTAEAVH
jgi:Na+/melibiose symporter-like transporter